MTKASNQYYSEFFEKGLRVLELFTRDRSNLSLKEIAKEVGITKPSAFRYVNTMVESGYLTKDPRTKLVKVGPKALALSRNLVDSHDVLQIVKKFIDYVSESHHLTIDSFLYEGDRHVRLYVASPSGTETYYSVPEEIAFYCTALGKAILAYLPKNEQDEMIDNCTFAKRTAKTITSKEDLLSDIEKIRQRGYAIHDEELIEGQLAIAAPFFNLRAERPMGAISFDFPKMRLTLEEIEEKYAQILLKLAKDISESIPN